MKANVAQRVTPPRPGRIPSRVLVAALLVGWSPSVGVAQAATAIRSGDSAWADGRFTDAKAAYERAVAAEPQGASRAVYRLAVLSSWDGKLAAAVAGFRRYLELEPRDDEGRIALGRAFAWAGQTDSAVAIYDDILQRDRTYRDAALGAAQALAWAGRFPQAIARYDAWLAAHGKDAAASLGRARTLAWAGRLGAADLAYRTLVAEGEVLEGSKGIAVVNAWRGDLFRAERVWRTVAREYPTDAEAWVGLAQVLRWSGRPEEADEALTKALAVAPANPDARAQRLWVRADLAPAIAPVLTYGWDSDGNRTAYGGVRASFRPLRRVVATLNGGYQRSELDLASGRSNTARVGLRWLADRRLSLSAEAGVTQLRGELGSTRTERSGAVGAVSATLKVTSRASIGGGVSRELFDGTAAIVLSAIDVETGFVEGEIELGRGLSMAAGGHRARLRGGSVPNDREGAFGSARWRPHRKLSLAFGGRLIRYDASPRDGYFSPREYRHGEVSARFEPRRDLGWSGYLDAGLGRQYVEFAGPGNTNATQRIAAGLIVRPAPGSELAVDYGFSNVASASSVGLALGSVYRYQAITARGRVRF